ncbi:MAG TPA: hypothetical protein VJR28_05940 [Chthoniobacterales bacterium]|nr:hypothetical protein [Chthoniobacterales bacterium]
MTALDIQKISSGIYFAAAALLICLAAMLAGRKVQRNLKAMDRIVVAVSIVTFGLIWLLLSVLNRREAEPRTSLPDYPAPSATP